MFCVINTLDWFIDASITYKSVKSQISQFVSWDGINLPYQKWSSDIRNKYSGRQTLMKKGVYMLMRNIWVGLLVLVGALCLCGSKTWGIWINSTRCFKNTTVMFKMREDSAAITCYCMDLKKKRYYLLLLCYFHCNMFTFSWVSSQENLSLIWNHSF